MWIKKLQYFNLENFHILKEEKLVWSTTDEDPSIRTIDFLFTIVITR